MKKSTKPLPQLHSLRHRAHQPRWRQWLDEKIWPTPEEPASQWQLFVKRWLQIFDRAFTGFFVHRGLASASALTYATILSLVPMLAVTFVLIKGFSVHEQARTALKQLPIISGLAVDKPSPPLLKQILPEPYSTPLPTFSASGDQPENQLASSADALTSTSVLAEQSGAPPQPREALTGGDVVDKLFNFVENTDVSNLGVVGVAGLLLVVFSMMAKIEDAMNIAWGVSHSRAFGRKLADYMNLLLVAVLILLTLSALATFQVKDYLATLHLPDQHGLVQRVALNLMLYVLFCGVLSFLYFYLPNTIVRWQSALISGVIAGTLFHGVQFAFIAFQSMLGRYNKIYGAFGIVLVMLLWVYVSWYIVLLGVELCSAHQNIRDLRRHRRTWLGTPAELETLALRLVALLARPLLNLPDAQRMDVTDLSDLLLVPPGPVNDMVELLQENGLIVQTADEGCLLLSRSPEQLTMLDVLRLVRRGSSGSPANGHAEPLTGELTRQLADKINSITIRDLAVMPMEQIQTIEL